MAETIAYFDCFCGAAGDMILGSLVDAGAPLEKVAERLGKLSCGSEIGLAAEGVRRCGISATRIRVEAPESRTHRNLESIGEIIESSRLSDAVKGRAMLVFTRLAAAEARVHGVPVDEVHFHETGALDAIADIVGIACALELLGVGDLFFSTLSLGGGKVECAHGTLPVPAPATAELVKGFRCVMGPVERELLTPTGAAALTALGRQEAPPPYRVRKVGYGAGTWNPPGVANVVQVVIGETVSEGEGESVWVVEANLDDTTPEVCGYAIERLLDAGAVDAYATPIMMKRSRPAFTLSALAPEEVLGRVEEVFFRETTTLGVRMRLMRRSVLEREVLRVETEYGPVRVKAGLREGERVVFSPEFADCRKLALERDVPLRDVMDAAREAARRTV